MQQPIRPILVGTIYATKYCYQHVKVLVIEVIDNSHSQRHRKDNAYVCQVIGTNQRLLCRPQDLEDLT